MTHFLAFHAAVRASHCSNTSYSVPTASIFNDIHSLLKSSLSSPGDQSYAGTTLPSDAQTAMKTTNVDSAVLLAHSLGGLVALQMITGEQAN